MRTKWLLLALPLAILALLLQSAFWVPTYASQARGNPQRLLTFIRGTVGDAKYPNPILSTDSGTAKIFDKNVFQMLVDTDEHLRLVPMLADSWQTTEEAYVAELPERTLPNGARATAAAIRSAIDAARSSGELAELASVITAMEVVKGERLKSSVSVLIKNAKGKDEPVDVALSVDVPDRVKLSLTKVVPELFAKLELALGAGYFAGAPFENRFKLEKPELLAAARPKLSEVLDIGEHNPVITFQLHPNVKWHDGLPFTSADVKFTYEAIIDPKNASPRAASWDLVRSIEAPDPLTVRATYKKLYAQAIIEWSYMGMIPKHLLDAPAIEREMNRRRISGKERQKFSLRTSDFNRNPIGTGPFRFSEWLPDQYIHLQRNENYWRQKPEYHDLYFRVLPDALTLEVEFGAGALDLYEAQAHQAERYRHDQNYQVVDNKEGQYAYIGYNARRWPFQDARVRRALGMAIDVDSLIKYVISGQGVRSTGPYYSNTPYFDPDTKPLAYDPKAALALLSEAGFHKNAAGMLEKDGKPLAFTLVTNAGTPSRKAVMTVAQEAWRKIGVDCKTQVVEWTVFLEEFALQDNFDAMVFGWTGGDTSPDNYQIWHSSQSEPYKFNMVAYNDPAADALIDAIRRTYDQDEVVRLARQLHRMIAEAQPYTFLYEALQPNVLDKRIARVEKNADGSEHVQRIQTPPSGDLLQFFTQWRKLNGPVEPAH